MQRNISIIWAALILMTVISISVWFMQTPVTWPADNLEFHQQLIFNIIVALTHITGAVLFVTNLDVYKAKLRRAYIVLAIGAVLTGAGTLQLSLLTLLNLWETPYGQSGATMLPFLFSGITLYIAVRSFARLVGAKDLFLRAWVTLPLAFGLAALSTFLPHAAGDAMSELTYDLLVGVSVWSGSLMIFAGYLTHRVQQHTGQHYTHAVRWLKRALIFSGVVLVYVSFYSLVYVEMVYPIAIFNNFTAVISGLIWIRAGYAFALTKYYDTDVPLLQLMFTRQSTKSQTSIESVIDMVTSTAGLVSNTRDIDPLLDQVRVITSRLKPGEKPSPKNITELVDVYLKLETYLTTQEAIRTFTATELRARLSPQLRQLVDAHS